MPQTHETCENRPLPDKIDHPAGRRGDKKSWTLSGDTQEATRLKMSGSRPCRIMSTSTQAIMEPSPYGACGEGELNHMARDAAVSQDLCIYELHIMSTRAQALPTDHVFLAPD